MVTWGWQFVLVARFEVMLSLVFGFERSRSPCGDIRPHWLNWGGVNKVGGGLPISG